MCTLYILCRLRAEKEQEQKLKADRADVKAQKVKAWEDRQAQEKKDATEDEDDEDDDGDDWVS